MLWSFYQSLNISQFYTIADLTGRTIPSDRAERTFQAKPGYERVRRGAVRRRIHQVCNDPFVTLVTMVTVDMVRLLHGCGTLVGVSLMPCSTEVLSEKGFTRFVNHDATISYL